ncbi:MAG: pyrroloquinoline quinone-dependent dehydrogenase [Acidobacteriota bacterium]|nr:pyrroloquinoline quinone-dependent dehydrogenase [Acidobacteriota bacterium]
MSSSRLCFVACLSAGLLGGPLSAQHGAQGGDWSSYHGDLGAAQYAPHDQIVASNIDLVGLAWRWASPDNPIAAATEDRRMMPGAYKATPLEIDGRLYVSTSLGQVAAIDAKTGETIWVFDTRSRESGRPNNSGFNTRGVAYWTDGNDQRILHAGSDSGLWSIDAKTGEPVTRFGRKGKVDLLETLRRETNRRIYSIVGAPLVVGDIVVLGSAIFDGPTRKEMPPGDVQAFDIRTGELAWTFHNPPLAGQRGYDTWENGSADFTGNANIWTNLSADEELGLVYLPFGTPTNDWYGGHRLGDGLFGESIVCVKAETGEYVWHFQLIHHGLWDYDPASAPTLFDAVIDGRPRKAVVVVTKQGFAYTFDRVTGEPIWPIEERPVPQSDVPGERSSATQPFPTKPPPFESQGISNETIIDFTPQIRAEAIKTLERYRWGPIYTPPAVSTDEIYGTVQNPGWGGGSNWGGAATDPETGMLFVPSFSEPMVVALTKPDAARSNFDYVRGFGPDPVNSFAEMMSSPYGSIQGPHGLPIVKPPYGRITAYDMSRGEIAWQVPHGDGIRQEIIDAGLPDPGPVGSVGTSGPLLTKGLLFLNQTDDSAAGRIVAYDKTSGRVAGAIEVPGRPNGTPMSYIAGGKQYIVVATGGEDAALAAFALP